MADWTFSIRPRDVYGAINLMWVRQQVVEGKAGVQPRFVSGRTAMLEHGNTRI